MTMVTGDINMNNIMYVNAARVCIRLSIERDRGAKVRPNTWNGAPDVELES